jgi:N-acetyl-anhydromuramyl-L-alanine amidase AmpD
MSAINEDGMLIDHRVINRRIFTIEHGLLIAAKAIVLHQTDSSTVQETLNAYVAGGLGAHFLIDKNGQIYQTASLKKTCYHVGRLINSKCFSIDKNTCDSASIAKTMAMSWREQIKALDAHERSKNYPERYP